MLTPNFISCFIQLAEQVVYLLVIQVLLGLPELKVQLR